MLSDDKSIDEIREVPIEFGYVEGVGDFDSNSFSGIAEVGNKQIVCVPYLSVFEFLKNHRSFY